MHIREKGIVVLSLVASNQAFLQHKPTPSVPHGTIDQKCSSSSIARQVASIRQSNEIGDIDIDSFESLFQETLSQPPTDDLESLSYKELQQLAKDHGLSAKQKSADLIAQLKPVLTSDDKRKATLEEDFDSINFASPDAVSDLEKLLEGLDDLDPTDDELADELADLDDDDGDDSVVAEVSATKEVRNEQGMLAIEGVAEVDDRIKKTLAAKGITHFTLIQEQSLKPILEGKDIIGRSRTGTGKTVAFTLPLLQKLDEDPSATRQRGRDPRVLILCPTRELAKQVEAEINDMSTPFRLQTHCFYGGSAYGPQANALRGGLDIVVGTPGRVMDLINRGDLRLQNIQHAVLDEADEMLNMGFAEDVETIFGNFDTDSAQVLMFSATTPDWVKEISSRYTDKPVSIDAVGNSQTRLATTVNHVSIEVDRDLKAGILEDLIAVHGKGSRAIVFAQTKAECDHLTTSAFKSVSAQPLHGDMSQKLRDTCIKQFKNHKFQVLVATDVAARGLDISGVDLVVQLNPPFDTDTFVHRSGRTGRAGQKGTAVMLYSAQEFGGIKRLERELGFRFEKSSPPTTQQVMQAASNVAEHSLSEVNPKVVAYFEDKAQQMAEEVMPEGQEVPAELTNLLSKCLAAISGKKDIQERSILTGKPDMMTVMMKTERQQLEARDAFFVVNKLSNRGSDFSNLLGKIETSQDGMSLVFDMDIEAADSLVETATISPFRDFQFSICEKLPPLNRRMERRGGGGGRGGGGYGGDRRGGGYGDRRSGGYGDRRNGGYGDRRSGGSYGDRSSGGRSSYGKSSGGYGERSSYGRSSYSRGSGGDSYGGRSGGYGGGRSGGYRERGGYQQRDGGRGGYQSR